MAVVVAAAAAATAAANLFIGVRLQPGLLRPRFRRNLVSPLLRYGGGLTISGLAAIPLVTAERFFLASNHSTSVVAYYAVAMTLGTSLMVIASAVAQPMFPALVRLHAAGAHEDLRRLYQQAQQGIFLIVTPAAILMIFLAEPFLRLWAGPQYAEHSTFPLIVIVVAVWTNAFATIPYIYLLASGRTFLIARIHLLEILPYLVAAAVLTAKFGALGAALAWSSRVVLDSLLFVASSKRYGGLPWVPISTNVWAGLLVFVSLVGCTALLSTVTNSLIVRCACAAALLIVYIGVVWRLVLTRPERSGARTLARQILSRGGRADT
jgi:O-antigen/teichoic acid export membrane protein